MKVLGILKVTINGKLMRVLPGAKLRTGGTKHTSVVGFKRYGSFTEQEASQLTFTVAKTRDLDIKALQDLEDATINAEGDDGVTYLIANADCTSSVEISDKGGGASFTFEGDEAKPL